MQTEMKKQDTIEQLQDRVYNLTLYLRHARERYMTAGEWAEMNKTFSGLPGYAESLLDETDAEHHATLSVKRTEA